VKKKGWTRMMCQVRQVTQAGLAWFQRLKLRWLLRWLLRQLGLWLGRLKLLLLIGLVAWRRR
jgi:hypothetical protein